MDEKQKAYEILYAIAQRLAEGDEVRFEPDWGFGTALLIVPEVMRAYIGCWNYDEKDDDAANFTTFINDLYACLVHKGTKEA